MIIVHILLWILKIAGILLLLVLGLLLLGILTVLFVPVRYELSASGDIEEPEKITGKISIRYFFRLIRFQAAYENQKFHWMAGIAWKKIGQDKNEEPEEEIQEKETPEKYKEDKKSLEDLRTVQENRKSRKAEEKRMIPGSGKL